MRTHLFEHEAAECRRQAATAFSGKPEAPFLLSLAGAFETLARQPGTPGQPCERGRP
jgi:hypothetical protein